MTQNIEVGKTYTINHSRKGTFVAKVISHADPEWATVEIISGMARAMIAYNVATEGEQITIRVSMCTFTPESVRIFSPVNNWIKPKANA